MSKGLENIHKGESKNSVLLCRIQVASTEGAVFVKMAPQKEMTLPYLSLPLNLLHIKHGRF